MIPRLLSRLDFDFTADLAACDTYPWISHGHVGWSCVPLRSPSGKMTDVEHLGRSWRDTELFGKTPSFAAAVAIAEALVGPVGSIRVSSLAAGGSIGKHSDQGLRVHVPILTNPGAVQVIGGVAYAWPVGEMWAADYSVPHSARNDGAERRVHLIMVVR